MSRYKLIFWFIILSQTLIIIYGITTAATDMLNGVALTLDQLPGVF